MDVDSLIERVVSRYASASQYSDRGTLLCDLVGGSVKAAFETSFERPDRFTFFVAVTLYGGGGGEHTHTHRIVTDGDDVRVRDGPELRIGGRNSLGSAVATITGTSHGTAHVIPRLLMPERIGGRALFDWPERSLGAVEAVDGTPHFVVRLRRKAEETRVLVAEATLVIRRIECNGFVAHSPDRWATTEYLAFLTA